MNKNQHTGTNFNEVFSTRLPVVAGGLMWLSNAEYVAAAANAGILGFIAAAMFPDEIGRAAYATGNTEKGLLSAGQTLAFVKKIEPLAKIVATLEREANLAMARIQKIRELSNV